jgi:hypothetical protein
MVMCSGVDRDTFVGGDEVRVFVQPPHNAVYRTQMWCTVPTVTGTFGAPYT